jgi:hypothetical protein
MADVLERLRARNRGELDLPCGKVTLRRPSMRDCILAGNVPLPVLEKLDTAGQPGAELTGEDLAAMARVNDELVRRAVIAIDGEDVDLAGVDLAEIFTDEERDAIVAFANRTDAEGKG